MKNLDATYEQACMAALQGKRGIAKLMYEQAFMLEKKGKYYMELSNSIIIYNDNNKYTLSHTNI